MTDDERIPIFAIGQQWRRRDGEVVTVTELDPGDQFPVQTDGKYWHRADGTSCIDNDQTDLIELVHRPRAQPTPCIKSLTDDQLQTHAVAVQAEIIRRAVERHQVEAKRRGGLLA